MRGKPTCVYCGKLADTREHAPPKLIYVKPYPKNLATIPCCAPCNSGHSKDEQYFKLVLSFIGGSDALDNMHDEGGFVDKTLSHKEAFGLDDAVLESIGVDEFSRIYFKPDVSRLRQVLEKIAKGLCALKGWNIAELSYSVVCFDRLSNLLSGPTTSDSVVSAFCSDQGKWTSAQPNVFEYTVFRTAEIETRHALCAIRFYDSIGAVIQLGNLRDMDWRGVSIFAPTNTPESF